MSSAHTPTHTLTPTDECKREIADERQRAYQEQVVEYRKKMATATKGRGAPFPRIRGRSDGMMFGADDEMAQTKLPVDPGIKVREGRKGREGGRGEE